MRSKQKTQLVRTLMLHVFMVPLALLWLFPLFIMAMFSTMADQAIFSPGLPLVPGDQFMENLRNLQERTDFLRALSISVVVAIVYTAASVLLTSMAGWALASYRFAGRGAVLGLILGTLTLPYFVVVIPQYILVARDLNLQNTWFALIVPPLFNSLGVLFMRQAFVMLPVDLFDAARVEGVKEWRIYAFVAMPMAKPTIAALSIILFLASWNNYLWPLLIAPDQSMRTAPVALGALLGLTQVTWGGIMVGAVLMTAPMIAVFVFLQRYFVAGIAAGAVK